MHPFSYNAQRNTVDNSPVTVRCTLKALPLQLPARRLWPSFKFLKSWPNLKVDVINRLKIIIRLPL